jgi:hypothetical protein
VLLQALLVQVVAVVLLVPLLLQVPHFQHQGVQQQLQIQLQLLPSA